MNQTDGVIGLSYFHKKVAELKKKNISYLKILKIHIPGTLFSAGIGKPNWSRMGNWPFTCSSIFKTNYTARIP